MLILDTAALIARHRGRIALAAINTGAALFPSAPKRGRDTFKALHDHDPAVPIVELTVDYAVPDVGELVVRVRTGGGRRPAGRDVEPSHQRSLTAIRRSSGRIGTSLIEANRRRISTSLSNSPI